MGGWILVAALLLGGLATKYYMLLLFGVLYILALLMKKDVVVTTRGLEVYYQMPITTQYNFLGWDQIISLVREDKKHPELVALYFGMENKAKRLYFTRPDAEKIMALAREKSPVLLYKEAGEEVPRYKARGKK